MNSDLKTLHGEDITKNDLLLMNFFWLGVIFYMVSHALASTDKVNYILCNVFQILGLAMMIPSGIAAFKLKIEDVSLKILFVLYMCWSVFIVIQGVKFDYETIKLMLFNPFRGIFLYFVPLILFYPKKISYYVKLIEAILVLSGIYLILILIFIKDLLIMGNNVTSQGLIENFSQFLAIPAGFVLLTFVYYKRKLNLFALFIISITFILAVIRARRGLMFITMTMLLFSYLVYQIANKTKVVNTVISFFVLIIIAYSAILVYERNRKDTFSLITERFEQNTRSRVEEYFYQDLKPVDWVFGKGMLGEYFCPGVEEGVGRVTIYRSVIETGYLQVILNSGLIGLVLLLLILIPAMIRGFFRSKNILSKTAAIWIFLFLLYMYPGSFVIFSVYYILVWISVGICYSDQIRNMSDNDIKSIVQSYKR